MNSNTSRIVIIENDATSNALRVTDLENQGLVKEVVVNCKTDDNDKPFNIPLFLKDNLKPFLDLPHVGDVRQKGFMAGIELVKERTSKESYPFEEKRGIKVILEARKRGLIIRPLGDVLVIMPPLGISYEHLGQLMEIVHDSIVKVTSS